MTPATASDNATRTRLLDAAERCFADAGFEGASLRDITARAKVNLAAAHYHFGSKDELFLAVVERRLAPLNAERMRLLDEAELRSKGAGPSLEDVIDALVGPPLRRAANEPGGECMLRLMGRMQSEGGELWKRVIEGPLKPFRERLFAALRRALPELDDVELIWRFHFAIAAMAGVAADHHRLRALSGGRIDPGDVEGAIARLVPFIAAGMRSRVLVARTTKRKARRPRR
jgi:AcrR family transcriptional regulator